MQTYETLYQLAQAMEESWSERESVDWSEAEQLIRECQKISDFSQLPRIKAMIDYAAANKDWDNGEVKEWPDTVISELGCSDKTYTYRRGDNDDWEVYGVHLSGEEDWTAFVSTEHIAEQLVAVMNHQANPMVQPEPAISSAAEVIGDLVSDIEQTGGLIEDRKGNRVPKADEEWVDLGATVEKGHAWLLDHGFASTLTVTKVAEEG